MGLFGPKRVGLALGAGAARGLAHIGVLKALEAEGIVPAVITGTSMGAVVGSLYAACRVAAQVERVALDYDMHTLVSLADLGLGRGALMDGDNVAQFLTEHLPATFEELSLPFGCVSTDLVRSEPVVHREGALVPAVRASLSIPVVFRPVHDGNRVLVDGALTDPIPVDLARSLGAQMVVAVDVTGLGTVAPPSPDEKDTGVLHDLRSVMKGKDLGRRGTSTVEVLAASVETYERQIARQSMRGADIVISPAVHEFRAYDFLAVETLIRLGEEAGAAAVAEIRKQARLRPPA